MIKDKFYIEISKLSDVNIYRNVKENNNLKIGAIFKYKIEILSIKNLKRVFYIIKKYKLKYYLLGNGSNVLFAKEYFKGVLIKLKFKESKELKIVNASDNLNYINSKYLSLNIASLDFLTGVPCSMGGAIYMNAGAYNKSIKEIIEYVYIFDLTNFKYRVLSVSECEFKYRDSYFKHHLSLILGAKIKLIYQDSDSLLNNHKFYLKTRKEKLPLEYPSLGSIFKNPSNNYSGKLIEDLKLKGLKIGGCKVSEKHANVIVNCDNGKYKDILKLIRIIKKRVYKKYKIKLELEIIIFK